MAFNVSQLSAEISRNGVMKNNKFLMEFPIPLSLRGSNAIAQLTSINQVMSLYCESSNLPGVALLMEEVRRYGYGPVEKKPYAPIFTDINLNFRADANGLVWNFMHAWMRCAINYESRGEFNTLSGPVLNQYPNEVGYKYDPIGNEGYATYVTLKVFDDAGNVSIQIILREAFPVFVGDVSLNWGSRSDYARIPVTLSFFDWYIDTPVPIMNVGNSGQ